MTSPIKYNVIVTFSLLMSVPEMHGGVAIELALAQTIFHQEIFKKLKFSKFFQKFQQFLQIKKAHSARLRTVNSFTCRYCRVEVEAKLPKGDWIWPAIWMLPKHLSYGKWPASGTKLLFRLFEKLQAKSTLWNRVGM